MTAIRQWLRLAIVEDWQAGLAFAAGMIVIAGVWVVLP
jgi:hypothetical protein